MNFNKQRTPGEEPKLRCDVSSRMELAGKPNRGSCSCVFQLCHWWGGGGSGASWVEEWGSMRIRKSAAAEGVARENTLALLTPEALKICGVCRQKARCCVWLRVGRREVGECGWMCKQETKTERLRLMTTDLAFTWSSDIPASPG